MPLDHGVKFVCFDLGGVLVRLATGWEDACQRAGVALAHGDAAGWERHRELMVGYESGMFDEAGYLSRVGECLPGVTADAVTKAFDAYLLGPYPGTAGLLADLRSRGAVTGCLSNTNERHWRTMMRDPAYAPLRELDHRFASHDLRVMKPAEAAYRHVERRTGFAEAQVLFFDDKQENVDAAWAVGWRAERVDRVADAVGQMREFLRAFGLS